VAAPPEPPARPMTPEQERALVAATAGGDQAARERLVEAHLPAISGMARRYRSTPGVERNELLQEGVAGLLRAVKRYDPGLDTPLWAYASWWVRQAMQQLVSEVTRPIVLSDRALRGLARVKEGRRAFVQEHSRNPSVDELAVAADLAPEQIERLLALEQIPRSLEESGTGDDGLSATVGELLTDPVAEHEFANVLDQMEIEEVRDLTATLDDRERQILYEHYGIGRPTRTLRQIGEGLGVSAERVRQIEEQALTTLREAVARPVEAA
jgi:RNA polymerase primary sigma factor